MHACLAAVGLASSCLTLLCHELQLALRAQLYTCQADQGLQLAAPWTLDLSVLLATSHCNERNSVAAGWLGRDTLAGLPP